MRNLQYLQGCEWVFMCVTLYSLSPHKRIPTAGLPEADFREEAEKEPMNGRLLLCKIRSLPD